jgi:lantibiotic modifying enzyme
LRKGFGLCHGSSGNAYFLMSLYKATGDKIWQYKARSFLLGTLEPEVIDEVAKCEFSGYKV